MKTWLITGASSGLGRIMTEKLLGRGDRVIGTARRKEALSDLSAVYGELLHVAALDLTDTAAIRARSTAHRGFLSRSKGELT